MLLLTASVVGIAGNGIGEIFICSGLLLKLICPSLRNGSGNPGRHDGFTFSTVNVQNGNAFLQHNWTAKFMSSVPDQL